MPMSYIQYNTIRSDPIRPNPSQPDPTRSNLPTARIRARSPFIPRAILKYDPTFLDAIRSDRAPLGKLSEAQIGKGQAVLMQLKQAAHH